MRRWRWCFRRFWASKTQIFVHLGRETPQKRLRNGWRNGRVSAKVTASASPRGDQRSWGVALPSDQASRRSSPARAGVPTGPFSPTLYLKRPNELIFSLRIGPPVLPDLSKKRLNRGSAIKSKKLGYESHSNSMVRTGTFFCMGVLIVKVENLFFLIFS